MTSLLDLDALELSGLVTDLVDRAVAAHTKVPAATAAPPTPEGPTPEEQDAAWSRALTLLSDAVDAHPTFRVELLNGSGLADALMADTSDFGYRVSQILAREAEKLPSALENETAAKALVAIAEVEARKMLSEERVDNLADLHEPNAYDEAYLHDLDNFVDPEDPTNAFRSSAKDEEARQYFMAELARNLDTTVGQLETEEEERISNSVTRVIDGRTLGRDLLSDEMEAAKGKDWDPESANEWPGLDKAAAEETFRATVEAFAPPEDPEAISGFQDGPSEIELAMADLRRKEKFQDQGSQLPASWAKSRAAEAQRFGGDE